MFFDKTYLRLESIAPSSTFGVDCDFKGTGETEEELMNNLVDHAIKDHGYSREYVMKPEMQEKIKAQIKSP